MKFCKNLQRLAAIADPEWAPYWPNYKMLKKLIHELPSRGEDSLPADGDSLSCSGAAASRRQQRSESTAEVGKAPGTGNGTLNEVNLLGRTPGEIAYFKLLHAELKKAARFFERTEQEFVMREERVREGMDIMKHPDFILLDDKWCIMAKSIYRLYKDLLLFEIFAIMAYCSFSKILKKHDKVTGYETRNAFMSNVVNKANFTAYPQVLEMIGRCERMYGEVSSRLVEDGKEYLYEDERLFIFMVQKLNRQMSDTAEEEGAQPRRPSITVPTVVKVGDESPHLTRSLVSLVEENEESMKLSGVDDTDTDQEAIPSSSSNCREESHEQKRQRNA